MKIKFLILPLIATGFLFFIFSCDNKEEKVKTIPPVETATDISNVTVALPDSKGVDLVNSNCATCHSLRYIETQPDMPKKAWDKIVKKMVKNYGAPISDTTVVNQIIEYLATVKGKK